MTAAADILAHIEGRLCDLKDQLKEAERFGVNTPGFNQTLGAIDELSLLVEHITAQQ